MLTLTMEKISIILIQKMYLWVLTGPFRCSLYLASCVGSPHLNQMYCVKPWKNVPMRRSSLFSHIHPNVSRLFTGFSHHRLETVSGWITRVCSSLWCSESWGLLVFFVSVQQDFSKVLSAKKILRTRKMKTKYLPDTDFASHLKELNIHFSQQGFSEPKLNLCVVINIK